MNNENKLPGILTEAHKKVPQLNTPALPYTFKLTRVHKKELAGEGKIWLLVSTEGWQGKDKYNYSSYIKIPVAMTDQQIEDAALEMYKGLVKKYKLNGK